MAFVPTVSLWSSDGLNQLYVFTAVENHNAPQSVKKSVRQTNFRSQGAIIIPGGEDTWELTLNFAIINDGYENIIADIETLENTIVLHTPYLIRIDKSQTTFLEYKVKRTKPFQYVDRSRDLMLSVQKCVAQFDVNSW